MKCTVLTIVILIFFWGCNFTPPLTTTTISYPDSKQRHFSYQSYTDKKGNEIKHGIYKSWSGNDTLLSLYQYKDGKLNGKCVEYYPNGKIKTEINFKNGSKDGKACTWFWNGTKCSEGTYINSSKLGGNWRYWDSLGVETNYFPEIILGVWDGSDAKRWFYSDNTMDYIYKGYSGTYYGKWHLNGKQLIMPVTVFHNDGYFTILEVYKDSFLVQNSKGDRILYKRVY